MRSDDGPREAPLRDLRRGRRDCRDAARHARRRGGLRPNELGRVLILEYHRIDDTEGPWTRTPEHVRDDLESLYTRGYRLISLREATSSGLRYWLDELDRRPRGRFVSDGDADVVTIPAGAAAQLRRPLAPGLRSSKHLRETGRPPTRWGIAAPAWPGFPCPCPRARRKMVA